MINSRISIGERVRQCRNNKGLTQDELSAFLDISIKHMSQVERGVAGLSTDHWIQLSNILDVSLDYIFKGISLNDQILLATLYHGIDDREKEAILKFFELFVDYKEK